MNEDQQENRANATDKAPTSWRGFLGLIAIALLAVVAVVLAGRYLFNTPQRRCAANLKRLGTAIEAYRHDHGGNFPPWLSSLYPDYIQDKRIFICPGDGSHGTEGSKPDALHRELGERAWKAMQYMETDDIARPYVTNYCGRNDRIQACSYLYELCAAKCSLLPGKGNASATSKEDAPPDAGRSSVRTWAEVKLHELTGGESIFGRSIGLTDKSRFPIVRCFHHSTDAIYEVRNDWAAQSESPSWRKEGLTLNLSHKGAVYVAPFTWEAGTNNIRRVK